MDGESQKEQDARVEALWKSLHEEGIGELDINGLRSGLQRINHPLRNADAMLESLLKTVDSNGDGKVQFSEFRNFVEHAERHLWQMFKSIDRDHSGALDKRELKQAFASAGLNVSDEKFQQFFDQVDCNHDGIITFDEWRKFLLFIPAEEPSLRAALSYYTSTVSFTSEGDVYVSGDHGQGLGRSFSYSMFFGALIAIAKPPRPLRSATSPNASVNRPDLQQLSPASYESNPATFPWDPGEDDYSDLTMSQDQFGADASSDDIDERRLTAFLPDPGYFIAGGTAGVVSRTATAPLDRLKVFLIAQTNVSKAVDALKAGSPAIATKHATRPLIEAFKTLWNLGGIKSLFAGNGLNVLKVMPESAIKFGSYEGTKRAMARLEGHNDPRALQAPSRFIAAGIGGMISQFAIYPLDTLKFRMQCETVQDGATGNKLIAATARKMWQSNGVRAYYRGLVMGLIGVFPYSAIDLTTYEYIKRWMMKRNASRHGCDEEDAEASPGSFTMGCMGAFSGALGASIVYPTNLLRTRLQSQGTAMHPPTYSGIWDVTVKTVRNEGIYGLYRGITPNLLKVIPAFGITWVVYEKSKVALGLR